MTGDRDRTRLVDELDDSVHLWLTRLDLSADRSLAAAWWDLISTEEKARHDALLLEPARFRYLVARALVRTTLSRYADVPAAAWRFRRGEHGRPEVAGPTDQTSESAVKSGALAPPVPALRFNLSHSSELIACLVTLDADVGVDVEDTGRDLDMVRLADRFFAAAEAEDLRRLTGPDRRERFFTYWTLKESYIKARGRGLSIPLKQVSFQVTQGNTIAVRFDPTLADRESDWQFEVRRPWRNHLLAAAVRRGPPRGGSRKMKMIARQVVPLVDEGDELSLPLVASTPR